MSTSATNNAASLDNTEKTLSSTKSKSATKQLRAHEDHNDKDFALPKWPVRHPVEPKIEKISLDQFGNGIVDDLQAVSHFVSKFLSWFSWFGAAFEGP